MFVGVEFFVYGVAVVFHWFILTGVGQGIGDGILVPMSRFWVGSTGLTFFKVKSNIIRAKIKIKVLIISNPISVDSLSCGYPPTPLNPYVLN